MQNFDLPMGAKDSVKCSDLVGLFLLNQLSSVLDKSCNGLYRDDYLAIAKGTKSDVERMKKQLSKY